MLKHGILGLLNYKDMTGYEVMELFRDSLYFFWNAKTSQIYRELQGLEDSGWLVSKSKKQKGKPDKRIYHITDSGKEELEEWLLNDEIKSMNYPVLMKSFFMGELSPEASLPFYYMYRGQCASELKEYMMAKQEDSFAKSPFWLMTLDYRIRESKMNIEWCDYCIDTIKGMLK